MHGYKVSLAHKKIWHNVYEFLVSVSKKKEVEKAKIVFNGMIGFCDTLSKVAGFVFRTNPLKAQVQ